MARILQRLLREKPKPEILDLGPLCGPTVIYLADRGARVSVEEFEPQPPVVVKNSQEEVPRLPIAIPQDSGKYDLVLAWDHADFTPPAQLGEFGAELRRVLTTGGWLLMFCQDSARGAASQGRPSRYRLVADDRLICQPGPGPDRPRYAHLNREIERALAPLAIQGIHLQRSRMREIMALKP